jgi:hypothetical protein
MFFFYQLTRVMRGETVLIDYRNKLETAIKIGFTPSGGRGFIHLHQDPLPGTALAAIVWGFRPRNPWMERCVNVTFQPE